MGGGREVGRPALAAQHDDDDDDRILDQHNLLFLLCTRFFVVSEFVLQSRYYVHFRANIFGKGMNLLILPAMG